MQSSSIKYSGSLVVSSKDHQENWRGLGQIKNVGPLALTDIACMQSMHNFRLVNATDLKFGQQEGE